MLLQSHPNPLNGVEKNSVAISLMLNHNLTELLPQLNVKYPKF